MSPKAVVISTLVAFILGVVGLSTFGKGFLVSLEQADTTVGYLDLARQSTQKRDYRKADEYYKQALNFAETTDQRAENLAAAMVAYGEFLRMKRNPLKDVKLAAQFDEKARALRQRTY